jgi:hypothetical protein
MLYALHPKYVYIPSTTKKMKIVALNNATAKSSMQLLMPVARKAWTVEAGRVLWLFARFPLARASCS